jgi:hypothetical protein
MECEGKKPLFHTKTIIPYFRPQLKSKWQNPTKLTSQMSCLLFHGCQTIGPVGVSLWGKYYRFLSGQTIEVINTPWIRDSKQARHTKCIYVSLFIKKPKNHKTDSKRNVFSRGKINKENCKDNYSKFRYQQR